MARPGQGSVPLGLLKDFLEIVLFAARRQVRDYMVIHDVSQSLVLTLNLRVVDQAHGLLTLPYYWAKYVHDGRGRVRPGKLMIFFPNKRDDPRTAGSIDYPQKRGSRRSLTRAEYLHFLARNKFRRLHDLPPVMVVVPEVSAGKQAVGKPFYIEGLRFFQKPPALILRMNDVVRKIAPSGSRSATIRLR